MKSMKPLHFTSWNQLIEVWWCIIVSVNWVIIISGNSYGTKQTGIILCMGPANGRCLYNVTSSLIGWARTQHYPWTDIKPLHEPMLIYCQLNTYEKTSVKFESTYQTLFWTKCIWKCCLEMSTILFTPPHVESHDHPTQLVHLSPVMEKHCSPAHWDTKGFFYKQRLAKRTLSLGHGWYRWLSARL